MNIVTALQSEAQPLVDYFDLTGAQPDAPFQIYESEDLRLIISGPGKVAAASAVAYLAGSKQVPHPELWLNIGVAGHAERPVGEAILAGEVIDEATKEKWYPQPVFDLELDLETVRTVSRPVRTFTTDDAYDMEAAGFYDVALRFSTVERVHVMKVVSDGRSRSPDDVTESDVKQLVSDRLEHVERVLQTCSEQLPQVGPPAAEVEELHDWVLESCSLSVTQQHRLSRLIERWCAVYPERDPRSFFDPENLEAGRLMDRMEEEIESASIRYG